MQLGALRSALSAQMKDGHIQIVSAFQLADHKTKNFARALRGFGEAKKVLLIEAAENRNLELSARNIEGVELVRSHEVHPYHLLGATRILFTKDAAVKLSETLAKSAPAKKENAE
jgi:large subunit ribosomal protein L4